MKQVNVGVVGLGWFGEKHLQVLSQLPNARVVAVCSRTRERAENMARRYGVSKAYTDWERMLSDPELEAVSVVTHVSDHAKPVITAFEHGKHVLVEKPIAASLDEADDMIRAAKRSGAHFMVGHILRFENRYALAKQAISEGRIGRILSMYARRNIPGVFARPHLRYGTPISLDAIHDTDLMLWYLGDRVESVYATMLDTRTGAPNPEITWTVYSFRGGSKCVCESLWFLPENTPYAIDAKMEVLGDRGALYIDCAESGLLINDGSGVKMPDTVHWPVVHGGIVGALKEEIAYFVRCVAEDRKPVLAPPEDARAALEAVLAAEESAREGRVVKLS
ncbi:scyllo-inositol 2-dehydrogenase (NAD(+)) [archaeon HR01]|nr:scyllo-inositol 2-dehydrogenase (NAD(+)) [archaeon HR01]